MRQKILLLTLMLTAQLTHAENLVRNGNFSEGINGWSGTDLSVTKLNGNQYLKIWPRKRDTLRLYQTFAIPGEFQSYNISLKYKTDNNFSGKGITVSAMPSKAPDGVQEIHKTFKLKRTADWVPLNWNINFESNLTNCTQMQMNLQILPGQGRLYLDDIAMTGSVFRIEIIEPEPKQAEPDNKKTDSKPHKVQLETLPENHTGNLLKNGGFEDDDRGWRGAQEKNWEFSSGQAVIKVKNDDDGARRYSGFIDQYNIINDRNCTTFYVKGRYKTSKNYSGKGFRTSVFCQSEQSIANGKDIRIQATTEWTDFHGTIQFSKELPHQSLRFAIFIRKGTGKIYFDDLELYGITD